MKELTEFIWKYDVKCEETMKHLIASNFMRWQNVLSIHNTRAMPWYSFPFLVVGYSWKVLANRSAFLGNQNQSNRFKFRCFNEIWTDPIHLLARQIDETKNYRVGCLRRRMLLLCYFFSLLFCKTMINNKRCLVYPDFERHAFHKTEKKCVSKSMSCFRFTLKISIQVCLAF